MPNENLHEDFINSLPEELREHATPELVEHWDKYVQDKFTDQAAWEPYQSIEIQVPGENGPETKTVNVRDIPPEELQELLSFREIAADEQKFNEWYDEIGKLRNGGAETTTPPPVVDDDEYVDPELAQVRQELSEMRQWRQEREAREAQEQQEALAAQSVEWVNSEIDKIKKDYPDLTDEHVDYICALASRYPPAEDIVQKGFKDFQKLVGDAEMKFFEKKTQQPSPAERGGRANTSAQPTTTYEDASEAARARIREAMKSI